ncbi:hypothetical protein RclHR1_03460011 [Rhizophagus clarus]|uniref:F-box domain-containing protein n=2 Tax=Rhizophagus clarus TaxID=94130 RepID=A0A2Z6RE31_9GLOM|nr:hypothetical protein RclHR1_03460011 [Rhizophagus clarus]
MLKLNKDILYLIFEELQNDKNTLYSCLTVNKIWCEIIVLILWKNPWKYLNDGKEKSLFNIITSHISAESKSNLNSKGIHFMMTQYRRPYFDYINLCKHLNLGEISRIIENIYSLQEEFKISNIKIVIFNLLINENARFTHLYIPREFDYQIHLIPGAKYCFSQLEFLQCNTSVNTNVLIGLTEMCSTMRRLELCVEKFDNNREIVKLIETPKKLYNVCFLTNLEIDEPFCEIVENSLIKHSNTIQYFKITKQPITNILSTFKNLRILELDDKFRQMKWDCLLNLSLPYLQTLKSRSVPNNVLASLIENTKGLLNEIVIDFTDFLDDDISNNKLIRAIYKNCPILEYLLLNISIFNILEMKSLLINCQNLNGLVIVCFERDQSTWDKIFGLLTDYAPKNLFKFKFVSDFECKLDSLKFFFDNWKGRKSMLLQIHEMHFTDEYFILIDSYIKNGIVKNFRYDSSSIFFDEFEWN